MWCCIHNHAFIYRSVHILAGLGFSVLNFNSHLSWLLKSVGSREFTEEPRWEILSIGSCLVFFPQAPSPAHLLCSTLIPCPVGAQMDLSSGGSGITARLYPTYPTSRLMWGEQRLPSLPTSCFLHSQHPVSRQQKGGAFCILLTQGRASPAALGMDMPMGAPGAWCRDTQATPGWLDQWWYKLRPKLRSGQANFLFWEIIPKQCTLFCVRKYFRAVI